MWKLIIVQELRESFVEEGREPWIPGDGRTDCSVRGEGSHTSAL